MLIGLGRLGCSISVWHSLRSCSGSRRSRLPKLRLVRFVDRNEVWAGLRMMLFVEEGMNEVEFGQSDVRSVELTPFVRSSLVARTLSSGRRCTLPVRRVRTAARLVAFDWTVHLAVGTVCRCIVFDLKSAGSKLDSNRESKFDR